MEDLKNTISELRAGIAGLSTCGTEVCLKNSKGFYRPAQNTLKPALKLLEAVESHLEGLRALAIQMGLNTPAGRALSAQIDELTSNCEFRLEHANAAKSALRR